MNLPFFAMRDEGAPADAGEGKGGALWLESWRGRFRKTIRQLRFLEWYFSTTFLYHLCDLVLCLIVWFCFGKKGQYSSGPLASGEYNCAR